MILLSIDFENLHQILRTLYGEMMPLCGNMIGIAKGIAGLGALFYVAAKVWQALARAEPIDIYPLLRPFALGFCIMFFPTVVLGTINAVLSPVVVGCHQMMDSQTIDMNKHRELRQKLEREAMLRNPESAYLVSDEAMDQEIEKLGIGPKDLATMGAMYGEKLMYKTREWLRQQFQYLLELIFNAAGLVIDTIRTFFLVVLSILGPIALAISVYSGFESTLSQWICRYVSVYLWLPVSDIFSSVIARLQVIIIQADIAKIDGDPNFLPDSSDAVYTVFFIIGIIGYFTVPTVAGWIISAGGLGNMSRNINMAFIKGGKMTGKGAGIAGKGAGMAGTAAAAAGGAVLGNIAGRLKKGRNSSDTPSEN